METFAIRDLTFYYPEQTEKTLDEFTLNVKKGEFLVLCGPSGCGKSTLLRQLKTALAPHGTRTGEILFEGQPLDGLNLRTQSQKIGFVMQNPDHQIVTDKVWHELAFGLESLGYDTPAIRRRVAEMASFFGIQTWFYKSVTELSGGQKQLLNLASVMVMQPSVLILDEPTSQLDPIAASDFLETLGKINRELGTTVILTEHRLEEALPLASRAAVMDRGRLLCEGSPAEIGQRLREEGHAMFLAMPAPMRIWAAVETTRRCPITVRDGREWIARHLEQRPPVSIKSRRIPVPDTKTAVAAENLWFRYEKELPDVVKGLTLNVRKGEFLALLGGNGTGKTTSLRLLAGLRKPYRGQVTLCGSVGVLPQNPQTLFVKKTVREDLYEVLNSSRVSKEDKDENVDRVVRICRLEGLLNRHPYDLSGGEQQRAALAKILLLDPEILLMDEPTKGMDAAFKYAFAEILRLLLHRGVTILMVSHDIEFCAQYAHRCALFFDGGIAANGTPRDFFSGNSFYTTAANRMARGLIPGAVTAEDVISACGGTVPPEIPLPEEPAEEFRRDCPHEEAKRRLPRWRKAVAAVSAAAAGAAFFKAVGITDLTAVLTPGGTTAAAEGYAGIYAVLIGALLILALAVGRKSPAPKADMPSCGEKRRLSKRTVIAAAMILLMIPITLFIGVYYLGGQKYYFIALLVLLECMLPFFLIFEGRKPKARELVIIAVLCAFGVAGRAALFMLPQFKPVLALTIIGGAAFGGETGFLLGAMTMLLSNVMFAQGAWTPWQMFAMGIIGFLAGVLFRKGFLLRTRLSLCIFGGLSAILIYGGIMNPASALIWTNTLNFKIIAAYCIAGFPMDLVHAAATVLFLWFGAEPMLEKLERVKVKYGLVE